MATRTNSSYSDLRMSRRTFIKLTALGAAATLIGNRVYRRYLEVGREALRLNKEKIRQEALYDGKYVLLTNSGLDAAEVALSYKGLWMVERASVTELS